MSIVPFGGGGNLFFDFTFEPFALDVQPKTVVNAHVLVRNPH
jgi:hypothetical protein